MRDRQIRSEVPRIRQRLADNPIQAEKAGLVEDRGVERADREGELQLSAGLSSCEIALAEFSRLTTPESTRFEISRMRHFKPGMNIGLIGLGLGHAVSG